MTYQELINKYTKEAIKLNKESEAIKLLVSELSQLDNIYLHYEEVIEQELLETLIKNINHYLNDNVPVQYLLGYSYFYGEKFIVNSNVLIPRFDTEVVVEQAITKITQHFKDQPIKIIDIGTGSGIIAITLKKHFKNAIVYATDISFDALEVCKQNAKLHEVDLVIKQANILEGIDEVFDVIISNPPYISKTDPINADVLEYEPHLALFADEQGMEYYHIILKQSLQKLTKRGIIIFEIGYNQATLIAKLASKYYPTSEQSLVYDYGNNPRGYIIEVKNK